MEPHLLGEVPAAWNCSELKARDSMNRLPRHNNERQRLRRSLGGSGTFGVPSYNACEDIS